MIVTGQVATATSAAVALCTVPPGSCQVVVTNSSTTAADIVYLGTASGVTASDGAPVPASASVRFDGLPGSAGGSLYVIAGAGTPVVGFILSTPV